MIRYMFLMVACYLSLDVTTGRRWFRSFVGKANRPFANRKDPSLSSKCHSSDNDQAKKRQMKQILRLCDNNICDENGLQLTYPRSKIPCYGRANTYMAGLLLLAAVSMTVRSFSASDSYSWYSLLAVASFCIFEHVNAESNLYHLIGELQVLLLRMIPFRLISRMWGRMCDLYVTPSLRPYLYNLYIKTYNVNMEDAVIRDVTLYETLGDFFRRKIDPILRPIDCKAHVVSPVDGTIMHHGVLCNGMVQQIKGISYSIQNFLGPLMGNAAGADMPLHKYAGCLLSDERCNDLFCCVIYLAPGDYHRFHSPAKWHMKSRRHFVGDLLSVNPTLASWVPDLFVLNERVALSGKWQHGFFSMTAVGATNVGSIVVYEDKNLKTNQAEAQPGSYFDHCFSNDGVQFSKGDSVGEFKLGSTVVLIYEAPKGTVCCTTSGKSIKYGEALTSV